MRGSVVLPFLRLQADQVLEQATCVDTLVKKSSPQQCAHCDTVLLPEKKNPIVAIKREGTGYAGGGMAEAKKFGVSFQA